MIKRYALRTGFVLSLALLLGACQTPAVDKADSPYYTVPATSKLILNREITIPANTASVYLQGGAIKPYPDIDDDYPHCIFEVSGVKPEPQTVKPGIFIITKVMQKFDFAAAEPVRVAALAGAGHAPLMLSGGPSRLPYDTIMWLESAEQPWVRQINCRQWEDPTDPYFVTINEIKAALGEIFTLELAR